jgi:pilus assembly protein CpaC
MSLITSQLVKAAEVDYSRTPIPQMLGANKNELTKTAVQVSPYRDNNEKLYAVVGKSQLIKFDEPVKRISITDPGLADLVLLSPKELLLNGKKPGRTSLVFWGNSDKPVFFNMVVQQDPDSFIQAVEQVAPDEDVKYTFTDDGVILSGKVSSTTVKKNISDVIKAYNFKLLDLTESPTKQVLLEVKITEASRNFTRNLESKFTAGNKADLFILDILGLTADPPGGLIPDIASGMFNGSKGSYIYRNSASELSWMLNAAETKGEITILAEPKLLAIDGQAGSFNVGNEIPIPSSVAMGGTVAYSFKNTGVILNFTPTILEKSNRVILKLSPEVSEVDTALTSPSGVPGFKTRKVDTTVELADGETLIIAGLLSHTASHNKTQIPWLGDLPVVGILFGNKTDKKNDTELVIFITPKIIEVDKNSNRMDL